MFFLLPFSRIRNHYLIYFFQIVEIKERPDNECEMEFSFYLVFVKHSSIDDNPNDDSIETDTPKVYLKVQTLIEFDTFAATHGPGTYVDGK